MLGRIFGRGLSATHCDKFAQALIEFGPTKVSPLQLDQRTVAVVRLRCSDRPVKILDETLPNEAGCPTPPYPCATPNERGAAGEARPEATGSTKRADA